MKRKSAGRGYKPDQNMAGYTNWKLEHCIDFFERRMVKLGSIITRIRNGM